MTDTTVKTDKVNPTRNLESITREFLQTVESMGLDWVRRNSYLNSCLQRGLELGLRDLPTVKEADTGFMERMAREVLKEVESSGIDKVRREPWDPLLPDWNLILQYGLKQKLYGQSDVDAAQNRFIEKTARGILGIVEGIGLECIRKDLLYNKIFQRALERKFCEQPALDSANKAYLRRAAMVSLHNLEILGNCREIETSLKYGLENGLFSQADIDRACKAYEVQHKK